MNTLSALSRAPITASNRMKSVVPKIAFALLTLMCLPAAAQQAVVKPLYLWSSSGQQLSRTPPSGARAPVTVDGEGGARTWTLSPALSQPVTLAAGNFPVTLWLARAGGNRTYSVEVTFAGITAAFSGNLDTTPAPISFVLNAPSQITTPAGSAFALTIRNNTPGANGNREILVYPTPSAGNFSRIDLNSLSFINVDSVQTFGAPYPGGALTSTFTPGGTVYVRSVVRDPFGSFDITGANVTIRDPLSGVQINNAPMTQQTPDPGAATRVYEYAFVAPSGATTGSWTATVVAREGTENTVTDTEVGAFTVALPMLQVSKLSTVLSDPINPTNPKSIPGAIQEYTVRVTNQSASAIDSNTIQIVDAIPTNTVMCGLLSPVTFTNGGSGLTFTSANLAFNSTGVTNWTYIPQPTGQDSCDSAITSIRLSPQGSMVGNSFFEIRFRVKVN
jgi:hypothetical protein